MKRTFLLIGITGIILSCCSCKKYVQHQEQQAAVSIMTSGVWYVSGFKQNGNDITASFSGYLFKFDADNTVTGTVGTVSTSGTWSDNIVARTITTNFPGAGAPLVNLNQVWTITDSYSDSVSAKAYDTVNTTNPSSNFLQLKKQ